MLSLGQLIVAALLKFVWILLLQGPLALINIAGQGLQYLTGGIQWNIFFNCNGHFVNGVLYPPSWNEINVPWPFIGMCLLALCCGVVVFIIVVAKGAMASKEQGGNKGRIIQALKMAVIAIIVCISIPLFFFATTYLLTFFVQAIANVFTQNDTNQSLADYIYQIGYQGSGQPPSVPSDFSPPGSKEILQYNFAVQFIATYFSLVGIVILCWLVIIKTFEMFFLFMISPVIAITMLFDDGKRMNQWKNMVISKACIIVANYIAFWCYLYIVTVGIRQINANPDLNGLLKAFILCAFIAGSSIAVIGVGPLVATFFGDGTSLRESWGQFRSLVAGGMIARGLKKGGRWLFGRGRRGGKNSPNKGGSGSGGDGDDGNDGFESKFQKDITNANQKSNALSRSLARGWAWTKNGVRTLGTKTAGEISKRGEFEEHNEKKAQKLFDARTNAGLSGKDIARNRHAQADLNKYRERASRGDKQAQQIMDSYNAKMAEYKKKQEEAKEPNWDQQVQNKMHDLKVEDEARRRMEEGQEG